MNNVTDLQKFREAKNKKLPIEDFFSTLKIQRTYDTWVFYLHNVCFHTDRMLTKDEWKNELNKFAISKPKRL